MLRGKLAWQRIPTMPTNLSLQFFSWSATFSADCPELQPGIGALASSRDTAFGTLVSFTCPIGQEFATGKTRLVTECLPGGNWSVSYIPKCQGE